jgi:hypothetical protein
VTVAHLARGTAGPVQPLRKITTAQWCWERLSIHVFEWGCWGKNGNEKHHWKRTSVGVVDTEGGLDFNGDDLAKTGYRYLHDGSWDRPQIDSKVGEVIFHAPH